MGITRSNELVVTCDIDGAVIDVRSDSVYRVRTVAETGDGQAFATIVDETQILCQPHAQELYPGIFGDDVLQPGAATGVKLAPAPPVGA